MSNAYIEYTNQYAVADDVDLVIVFLTLTAYSNPRSVKYRCTVLSETGLGKLAFKSALSRT